MTTGQIVAIIGCIVGVITCLIGVATFVSAQLSKAKQDGVMIAKIDQCIKNTEEIKAEAKENNKKIEGTLNQHNEDIARMKEQISNIFHQLDEMKGVNKSA